MISNSYKRWETGSGSVPNIEGWVRKNLSYLCKQFIMEDCTCFWVKGNNGNTCIQKLGPGVDMEGRKIGTEDSIAR